tara:strand:- start:437 stop:589 length:153 start_codon:yes stop_codon:yes gene_type:complete
MLEDRTDGKESSRGRRPKQPTSGKNYDPRNARKYILKHQKAMSRHIERAK